MCLTIDLDGQICVWNRCIRVVWRENFTV